MFILSIDPIGKKLQMYYYCAINKFSLKIPNLLITYKDFKLNKFLKQIFDLKENEKLEIKGNHICLIDW